MMTNETSTANSLPKRGTGAAKVTINLNDLANLVYSAERLVPMYESALRRSDEAGTYGTSSHIKRDLESARHTAKIYRELCDAEAAKAKAAGLKAVRTIMAEAKAAGLKVETVRNRHRTFSTTSYVIYAADGTTRVTLNVSGYTGGIDATVSRVKPEFSFETHHSLSLDELRAFLGI